MREVIVADATGKSVDSFTMRRAVIFQLGRYNFSREALILLHSYRLPVGIYRCNGFASEGDTATSINYLIPQEFARLLLRFNQGELGEIVNKI